jgi:hypothetical protein
MTGYKVREEGRPPIMNLANSGKENTESDKFFKAV